MGQPVTAARREKAQAVNGEFTGPHPDPGELRALAAAVTANEPDWRARVDALPASVLTRKTLDSEPEVIAKHLLGVAVYVERRRNGAPFGVKAGEPFYESWLTPSDYRDRWKS